MKHNQKGKVKIFIVAVIIVLLGAAGFLLLRGKTMSPLQIGQQTGIPTNQAIQSASGLQNASQELDNTNVDGTFDPEINQNTTDAQTLTSPSQY